MVRASDLDTIGSWRFENDQEAKDEQARLANRDIERYRKREMSVFVCFSIHQETGARDRPQLQNSMVGISE
jgi:hypothetical protein